MNFIKNRTIAILWTWAVFFVFTLLTAGVLGTGPKALNFVVVLVAGLLTVALRGWLFEKMFCRNKRAA